MKKTISICIPVFNEAQNLRAAIAAVDEQFLGPLAAYDQEIVITDNASTDGTWELIQQIAAERKDVRAFRFSRNFGYQNSVFAGLSLATGDAVVELDADLEDPPAVIPFFVEKWEQGFDVAVGVRQKRHGSWFMRALFALFYRVLDAMAETRIPRDAGDFRLLDRRVVDVLKNLPERNLYLRGLVAYLGFKQALVPYERHPRAGGHSKFSFWRYLLFAMDALTAFSKTPLRVVGLIGGLLFLMSLGLSANYLIGYLRTGAEVPGFTTLVLLTLGMNSVTFIFLGVLGEYLGRIFDDMKGRPRVVIRDAVNADRFPPSL